ncbi:unnamed protein product [Trichogramma brassicae]|uniref:Uncharacterized protein n=1 Tax=Trichogramma brassicae TaxID=86971 RepID=A0A6H5IPM5_9HYME|nr:unnamed protein product [Trichogramma brassicae]
MADATNVRIVLEIINIADDDNINVPFLMEVGHQAPVGNSQADNDVEVLAELPRRPSAPAPQPDLGNDDADDDVIFLDAASCDMMSDGSVRSSVSAEESGEAGSSAADSGRGDSTSAVNEDGHDSPNEDARAAAQLEQQPPRPNELQVDAGPASPDPEVNRGFALDRLPAQVDVNAWLRRVEQQQAPIVIPEQVIEWRVGHQHLNRMVLLRQPNPRFLEREPARGQLDDLPQQDRDGLLYLINGFRPNFPLVEDCNHALLWAYVLPTGAWRGVCCLEGIQHFPGLVEVVVHKTGLKGALREQCGVCPGCHLPAWREVGARHCDMCTRIVVLNQDAILSRRILKSSPPSIRRHVLKANEDYYDYVINRRTHNIGHQYQDTISSVFAAVVCSSCSLHGEPRAHESIRARVTLDVKNSFNSARWSNIHAALRRMHVPEYLLRIVASYLSARELDYDTDDGPESYRVTAGVPQGSVLGPIL